MSAVPRMSLWRVTARQWPCLLSVHTIETLSPIQHLLFLAEQVAVSSVCKAIPIAKLLLTTKAWGVLFTAWTGATPGLQSSLKHGSRKYTWQHAKKKCNRFLLAKAFRTVFGRKDEHCRFAEISGPPGQPRHFHMEATAAVAPGSRDLQGRLPVTRSFNNSQAKEVKSDASRQMDQNLTFGNAEDSKLQFVICFACCSLASECKWLRQYVDSA